MSQPSQSLSDALASLPEEERIILLMHYVRSIPASEIAAVLGVPVRSVNVIICQGKARLSAILGI